MVDVGLDLAPPDRALAIGAHADDVEFGCGATLAKWATAGCEVQVLVLTDGSKGSWDPAVDVAALVDRREREARAAGAVLGAAGVRFLRLVDGELRSGPHERAAVCEAIRALRPSVVLGHDPWKHYRIHPDHREAGLIAVEAIVAARDPHFFADRGPVPHRPEHLLLFEAEVVDHLERVGEREVEAKIAALLCHESQWRSTMGIDVAGRDPDGQRAAFEERVRTGLREVAAGALDVAGAAEAFKHLDDL
jgi:LmbE family N-acetylglucosaminyl deacetylase